MASNKFRKNKVKSIKSDVCRACLRLVMILFRWGIKWMNWIRWISWNKCRIINREVLGIGMI